MTDKISPTDELKNTLAAIKKAMSDNRAWSAYDDGGIQRCAGEWYSDYASLTDQAAEIVPLTSLIIDELMKDELSFPPGCVLGHIVDAVAWKSFQHADDPEIAIATLKRILDDQLARYKNAASHDALTQPRN